LAAKHLRSLVRVLIVVALIAINRTAVVLSPCPHRNYVVLREFTVAASILVRLDVQVVESQAH
jgi:hypothetical protein